MIFDNYKFFIIISIFTGIITFLLVISKSIQINISKERVSGPQKIHESFIPRIGGISIYLILFLYSLFYFEDRLLHYIVLSSSLFFLPDFLKILQIKYHQT